MSYFRIFAAAAPGLEEWVAYELSSLGLGKQIRRTDRENLKILAGGVLFEGGLNDLYRANLHLRTASRVLVRVGEFYAAAFSELHKKSSRLEWERFLSPGQTIQIHATCHKSRLYHTGAVAQRIAAGIASRLGKPSPVLKAGFTEREGLPPAQLVVVRLSRDRCTISVDSSGALLHQRGYRLEGAKAPLRETLAAGMLYASGWDFSAPLLDPFCGSGTIAIEAALMALGTPPGRLRSFAFMDWPGYEAQRWKNLLEQDIPHREKSGIMIQASDRDAGAVQAARNNAELAGVAEWIEFSQRAVSAIEPPPGTGWVVTNPPYGVRIGQRKDLRNLYAQIGNVLRSKCPGWELALLGSDPALIGQIGFPMKSVLSTLNGGLNVRLMRGRVPEV